MLSSSASTDFGWNDWQIQLPNPSGAPSKKCTGSKKCFAAKCSSTGDAGTVWKSAKENGVKSGTQSRGMELETKYVISNTEKGGITFGTGSQIHLQFLSFRFL